MEEYKKKKATMDPRRFNAMYNGEFEKMHGLVYDCFDEATHVCDPQELPMGTKFYAGVDWGYRHPFVIVVRAVTPNGMHFQVSEFYKTNVSITDMILVAKQLKQVWGIQVFYCDPAQPGYIEEFNRNGCSAQPADNDISKGIGLHYGLIKEGKFKIFKGTSPYTIDEYETYHFEEDRDLKPDQKDKEPMPVDQDNHAMDASRYVTVMTYHSAEKKAPHIPGLKKQDESNAERIQRLKTRRQNRNAERWS
jgi:phage terminase large subunit